jgi:SAM-dependent MidA family methyltransferase
MTSLPLPSTEALHHSRALEKLISDEIARAGGWIDFARYMHLALYAPGLGYYSGGAEKFGEAGDFVTAPGISPLFAQCLAKPVMQVIKQTEGDILELGAGTGKLAGDLLLELQGLGQLPSRYLILEVSAYLREAQRQTLSRMLSDDMFAKVQWIDHLPSSFNGFILANEVLDALPVHLIGKDGSLFERGVSYGDEGFCWIDKQEMTGDQQKLLDGMGLPDPYLTEICPFAAALVASLADMLEFGAVMFIDYGFPRREYYHPQRAQGTLMCHYRHHAHGDPFLYPGLQDITAHVDFTYVAEAAVSHGLRLLGYATQAQFLINCGITDLLARVSPADTAAYLPLAAQAQKLLSPAEMGDLFKVIAMGKGLESGLIGFQRGDKAHSL